MGLLESLRNIKFQPSAGSMGLLNAGAQMLANSGPSLRPQGFGQALGQGIGGFTDGFMGFQDREAEQEDALIRRQLLQAQMAAQDPEAQRQKMLNEAKIKAEIEKQYPRQVDPYTTIERGPNGEMYLANHRETDPTKALQPALVNGQTVRHGALDPWTQGNITQAKEENKIKMVTLGDGRKVPMRMQEAVGNTSFDFKDPGQAAADIGNQATGDPELDLLIQQSRNLYNQRNPAQGGATELGQSTEAKKLAEESAKLAVKEQGELNAKRRALPAGVAELDAKIKEIETLSELQKNTSTGPLMAFPGVAQVSKMLPGGEKLQRLESGYNKVALDTFVTLKQQGATFGALSNEEGIWLKSVEAKIQNNESVNLDLLNRGVQLLKDRKNRMYESSKMEMPDAEPTKPTEDNVDDLLKLYGGQ